VAYFLNLRPQERMRSNETGEAAHCDRDNDSRDRANENEHQFQVSKNRRENDDAITAVGQQR
jgi:hypothetical protein